MFIGFDLKFFITNIWETLGSFSTRCIFPLFTGNIFLLDHVFDAHNGYAFQSLGCSAHQEVKITD